MLTLETETDELFRVGPKTAKLLYRLGIKTVADFLFYFPVRHNDFSKITPIQRIKPGEILAIRGTVSSIENRRTRIGRKMITEALISDSSGSIMAVWFNQPFLTKVLKRGSKVILAGMVEYNRFARSLTLNSPEYEVLRKETLHAGRIVPIYSETKGISSKWLRVKIKPLLKFRDQLPDLLPLEIREELNLPPLSEALLQIHFPDSFEKLEQARRRFSFEELFLLALSQLLRKAKIKKNSGLKIAFQKKETKKFVEKLPFKLTNAQRKVSWEILKDIEGKKGCSEPMCRLLNGDVGSGKTVVAAIAALNVARNGYRTILMAPTEVLALQHYKTLKKLFAGLGLSIGLYTRSYQKPKKALSCNLVVGTHSLIQDKVDLKKIGLVIVDEQHRFGVRQRKLLREKGKGAVPHLLSMSATPIPRTMSLILFGDLDISVLDELPKERKAIISRIVPPRKREIAYEFIRKQITYGRQVFVICPLIEESDILGIKSAVKEHNKLSRQVFPDFKVDLLYGKMKPKEKEKAMKDFSRGKTQILVSTSVVEVGVDVRGATVMMIEGAERFGLSQLHQFRGRVGRGSFQSYFFMFASSWNEKIAQRLKAVAGTRDGFKIARIDLKLRGPGEVFGLRQSGIPDLKVASFFDFKMVKLARLQAEKILKKDPELNLWPELKKKVDSYQTSHHLE